MVGMNNPQRFLPVQKRTMIYCASPAAATGPPGTEKSSSLECGATAIMRKQKEIYGARWWVPHFLVLTDNWVTREASGGGSRGFGKSLTAAPRQLPPTGQRIGEEAVVLNSSKQEPRRREAGRVIAEMLIFDNPIKASKVTNDSHKHCWERFHWALKSTKRGRNSLLDNESEWGI